MIGATGRRFRGCYRSAKLRAGPQTGLERVDLQPPGAGSASIAGLAGRGAAVPSWREVMIWLARSEAMQLRLDLGGSPAPAVALWELVGSEERRSAIALLAALIARAVTDRAHDDPAAVEECGATGGKVIVGE
jgi:hypothetical protein